MFGYCLELLLDHVSFRRPEEVGLPSSVSGVELLVPRLAAYPALTQPVPADRPHAWREVEPCSEWTQQPEPLPAEVSELRDADLLPIPSKVLLQLNSLAFNFPHFRITNSDAPFADCIADSRRNVLRFDAENEAAPPQGKGNQLTYRALPHYEYVIQQLQKTRQQQAKKLEFLENKEMKRRSLRRKLNCSKQTANQFPFIMSMRWATYTCKNITRSTPSVT